MERREGRDAVVAVHVARRAGGGGGHVCPADLSEGAEGDDVTEAFAILQFFGDRLRVKHKTIVILKHIQTAHMSPAAGPPRPAAIMVELKGVCGRQIGFLTRLINAAVKLHLK